MSTHLLAFLPRPFLRFFVASCSLSTYRLIGGYTVDGGLVTVIIEMQEYGTTLSTTAFHLCYTTLQGKISSSYKKTL